MQCPKCQYQRQAADHQAPDWQCPACGVAYVKAYKVNLTPIIPPNQRVKHANYFGKRTLLDYALTLFILCSVLLLVIAFAQKDQLPDHTQLLPALKQNPLQTITPQKPFTFAYRGEQYAIEPVAEYELWGMVVTHNDITGITDIMHTKDSVDIKDICLIWGNNIRNSDYQKMQFSSGDFICYFQYPSGVSFQFDEISNNHLLADNEAVRDVIHNTRIGDQIHLRGQLINYHWLSKPNWLRRTSTTRNDTGNGACEVVFVKEFEVLKATNGMWHNLYSISKWLVLVALLAKIGSFFISPSKQSL